jgi:hypothetical protein
MTYLISGNLCLGDHSKFKTLWAVAHVLRFEATGDEENYGGPLESQSLHHTLWDEHKNTPKDADPLVQLLYELPRPAPTLHEQPTFVKILEFQKDSRYQHIQRREQLGRHRRISRTINGVKVMMRNS